MTQVCMLVTNRAVDDVRVCMEAHALAQSGRYNVTVVGWDREIDQDVTEQHGDVMFHRLMLRSTHARGLSQALYLVRFWRRARKLIQQMRPQVVHCHDLDSLPAGMKAAARCGARVVFDAHENYPDMMDGHLPRLAVRWLSRLERRLVPRCDLLVTVGERLAEHYRALGARAVQIVGNWKDAQDYFVSAEQVRSTRAKLGIDGRIVIAFIANLGRERHLEPLLEAVARDRRFACLVGGRGALEDQARRYAAGFDNIVYVGHVQPSQVPMLTAACDVIYYGFDTGNPNSRWSAPNKLYEAIAAGKPMLAGDFGEVGPTVREGGFGVLCDTSNFRSVAAAMADLAAPGAMERMGAAAQALQGRFSAAAARQALVAAYDRLCGRPVPSPAEAAA